MNEGCSIKTTEELIAQGGKLLLDDVPDYAYLALEQAYKQSPDNYWVNELIGETLRRLNKVPEAIVRLLHAKKIHESDSSKYGEKGCYVYLYLARCYRDNGDYLKGIQILEEGFGRLGKTFKKATYVVNQKSTGNSGNKEVFKAMYQMLENELNPKTQRIVSTTC